MLLLLKNKIRYLSSVLAKTFLGLTLKDKQFFYRAISYSFLDIVWITYDPKPT